MSLRSEKKAVILAGGKGTRLAPFTTYLPKPLVPLGDKPILEIVLRQLKTYGFTDVSLAVNHLEELIRAFFADGKKWGVKITYSIEDHPLNTVGPLTLIKDLPENFLVMNGDVLTDLNYRALFHHHLERKSLLSVATFHRRVNIDFGVMRLNNKHEIVGFDEKPTIDYDVSMGVYVMNRRVLDYIPRGKPFGFDHLMLTLLEKGERVSAYAHKGYWLDIGRPADYETAVEEWQKNNLERRIVGLETKKSPRDRRRRLHR